MIQMCMLQVFFVSCQRSLSTKRAHKIKEAEDFGQNPKVQSAVLKVSNIQTQNEQKHHSCSVPSPSSLVARSSSFLFWLSVKS